MRATLALAALLLLVVAFAALAPATLVDARIAALTRDTLRLADASGTVWSGGGALSDARGRWRLPVSWRLDAAALLRGALRVDLRPTAGGTARGTLGAADNTLELTALHVEVPAAALESAWTRTPVPRFEGVIVADTPSFRTDGMRTDGTLDLRWERARVALLGVALDLGTVEASVRPNAMGTTVALRNRGGDVALRGEARAEGNAFTLDATLTPSPALPQPALLALRALGAGAPDGSVHVKWQGQR